MWSVDQYKGAFNWRGDQPDAEPHHGTTLVLVFPIAAAIGFVVWLGWSWWALVLTILTTLLVAGPAVLWWVKRSRRERAEIPEWR